MSTSLTSASTASPVPASASASPTATAGSASTVQVQDQPEAQSQYQLPDQLSARHRELQPLRSCLKGSRAKVQEQAQLAAIIEETNATVGEVADETSSVADTPAPPLRRSRRLKKEHISEAEAQATYDLRHPFSVRDICIWTTNQD